MNTKPYPIRYEQVFLLAEHCNHDLYHGWHLYLREQNNGTPNRIGSPSEKWGWLQQWSKNYRDAREVCALFGHDDLPPAERYAKDFIEAFAKRFPCGLLVWRDNESGRILMATEPPQ